MSTQRPQWRRTAVRFIKSLLRAFDGIVGRMVVLTWLMVITLLVIVLLSETLSDAQASELLSVMTFSAAGVEVTAFGIFIGITLLWMLSPILLQLIKVYENHYQE